MQSALKTVTNPVSGVSPRPAPAGSWVPGVHVARRQVFRGAWMRFAK